MIKTTRILSFMLVATGLVAACFNTKNIQSGGLKCAPSSDPTKIGECPDGFFCGEGHLCYRKGTEGVNLCQAGEAQKPFGPFDPNTCVPPAQSTGLCDPVCQNGCSCSHRCQLVGNFNEGYSFACQAPPAGALLDDFAACSTNNDLCKPGRVCLEPVENSQGCVAQCFRFCRRDSDCPEKSRCSLPIDLGDGESGMSICSPPATACNPVQNGPANACNNSLTGSTCYVFSSDLPDETMCDCTGTIKAGDACRGLHSCVAGHECVDGVCQRVCLLAASGSGCSAGQTCTPYAKSTRFGTCR